MRLIEWTVVVLVSVQLTVSPAPARAAEEPGPREQFLAALSQFAEAAAGTYGDESPRLGPNLRAMRTALSRWKTATTRYEATLSAAARGTDPRRLAEQHLALVGSYLEWGQPQDALRELSTATRLDPTRADAWFLLGVVSQRLGRSREAARALTTSSRLTPDNPVPYYLLATELQRVGDGEKAARARQTFVTTRREALQGPAPPAPRVTPFPDWGLGQPGADVTPFFLPGAYTPGLSLLREGRIDEALDALEQAARRDSLTAETSTIWPRLADGAAALRRGDAASAVTQMEAAVDTVPEDREARRLLGMAYWAAGQLTESIATLETAVREDPGAERARLVLADVLVDAGRLTDAARVLEDTIQAIPSTGLGHYKLGQVSSTLRNYAAARDAFAQAVTLAPLVGAEHIYRLISGLPGSVAPDPASVIARHTARIDLAPNNPEAHLDLGRAYLAATRDDEAVAEFLTAILIDPRGTEAYAALGQAYLRMGDYPGAEAAARRAVTLTPTHAGARYALATSLARQGRAEAAEREFDVYRQMLAEAQTARRRDFEVGLLMRDVRDSLDHGALDTAIARLREATRVRPDDPALRLSLGVFLMNAGQYPDAAVALERALALGAGPDAHRYLADAYAALGRLDDAQRQQELFKRSRSAPGP